MTQKNRLSKCPKCGGTLHPIWGDVTCLNCGFEPIELTLEIQQEVEGAMGKASLGSLIGNRQAR